MPLLLTGASGFLGRHIIDAAAGRHPIYGWHQHRPVQTPVYKTRQVDMSDLAAIQAAFKGAMPDYVVHTAAISSIAAVEQQPAYAQQVNVEATALLARLCRQGGIPFIFCSTDLVFDGKKGAYAETDAVNPLNRYGAQKALAEQRVFEENETALVVRLPLLLGHIPGMAGGIIGELAEKDNRSENVFLFTDEYRSIAWAGDIAAMLLQALDEHWQGLYHLGGPAALNRYEAGLLVQQYYGFNRLHIVPTTHAAAGVTGRPALATLNSHKAFMRGYKPHSVQEALHLLHNRVNTQ